MTANPLVAGPVDTSTAFGGAGLLDSLHSLNSSLQSGDWVGSALSGAGVALDAIATAMDPVGSLIAAGLGWIMEHLEPLKGWLNDLTGDAGAVLGFAATWDNVASAMNSAGDELGRLVQADLEAMSGASVAAYVAYANGLADRARAAGTSASAMGSALRTCSTIVQVVHDLVRDTLSQIVGSIISAVGFAVLTVGTGIPKVIADVSARVASVSLRIGRRVTAVIEAVSRLRGLLREMQDILSQLASGVRGRLPGAAHVESSVSVAHPVSRDWGVAFFDRDILEYYVGDRARLGSGAAPFFHMPAEDAGQFQSARDILRETGHAPSIQRAFDRAGPDGPEIFGISFPREGLEPRVPQAQDAGGWPHYIEGGRTAVRQEDGSFVINQTREYVIDGAPRVPDGSVLFRFNPDGSWAPLRRFP
ncbi:hypothetical protein [Cellulomonas sp. NPDC058312]|uniref:hypothetical protein n=1 Tax=Cellulomonas sp. NPDC058312 TaxID=3346441 RepID=UPI0036ECA90B